MKPGIKSWVVPAIAIAVLALLTIPSRIPVSSSQANPAVNGLASDAGAFDVKSFGAKADGKTLDTAAINKAIDAAAAAGGGTVYFPAGNYLSVSIHLKSNIALYLDQGATIVAANTSNDARYDAPEPNEWDKYQDFGHSHWHNSLIWGENLILVPLVRL